MFATLAVTNNRTGRPPTPATLHRIRATLRTALNAAIRDGLIRDNPARLVELPTPRRPQALVWTEHRVAEWRRTGTRHPVAVWTAAQVADFLGFVEDDRLYAMWWLIALRGLRRGEAAGLRWVDVDLDGAVAGHRPAAHHLRLHHRRRATEDRRQPTHHSPGQDHDHGSCVPTATGRSPNATLPGRPRWSPDTCSPHSPGSRSTPTTSPADSAPLVANSGLPPIRLHDLRHGAASLAHAAGADLKTVQDQLGHTSIVLTADTYTSVLMQMHFKVAEATARLVLTAAAQNPAHRHRKRAANTAPKSAAGPQPAKPGAKGRNRKQHSTRTSRRGTRRTHT